MIGMPWSRLRGDDWVRASALLASVNQCQVAIGPPKLLNRISECGAGSGWNSAGIRYYEDALRGSARRWHAIE